MANNVKFKRGRFSKYVSLAKQSTIDSNSLYFLDIVNRLYQGGKLIAKGDTPIQWNMPADEGIESIDIFREYINRRNDTTVTTWDLNYIDKPGTYKFFSDGNIGNINLPMPVSNDKVAFTVHVDACGGHINETGGAEDMSYSGNVYQTITIGSSSTLRKNARLYMRYKDATSNTWSNWDMIPLSKYIVLTNSTTVDSLTDTGTYYLYSALATTVDPIKPKSYAKLEVYSNTDNFNNLNGYTNNGTSYTTQKLYIGVDNGIGYEEFVRSHNGTAWTGWKKLANSYDITTTVNNASTDTQLPTAKAVYTAVNSAQTTLQNNINTLSGRVTTVEGDIQTINQTITDLENGNNQKPLAGNGISVDGETNRTVNVNAVFAYCALDSNLYLLDKNYATTTAGLGYNATAGTITARPSETGVIAKYNVSSFLQDNMLANVTLIDTNTNDPKLKFEFNTSNGTTPTPITVSVASLYKETTVTAASASSITVSNGTGTHEFVINLNVAGTTTDNGTVTAGHVVTAASKNKIKDSGYSISTTATTNNTDTFGNANNTLAVEKAVKAYVDSTVTDAVTNAAILWEEL